MLITLRLSAQTDEQLMQRAAKGNDRAFEELYNRHARRLQGFFARRLGADADLAADFMHDVFLRLYDARQRYREGQNVRAWLYTIAYNLWKNHMRKSLNLSPITTGTPITAGAAPTRSLIPSAGAAPTRSLSPTGEGSDYLSVDSVIDDGATPEVIIDNGIFRHALREVLRQLPEPQAMLFTLHYEEELTIPQIALITSLPEGTVKSRLHKIMNTIKQQLKEYENK